MDYREALLDVYKNHYTNGVCPNIDSCSTNMPVCGHRYSVARLGCNYGNTEKPKVLFVGKEGTDSPGKIDPSFIKEPASLSDDVRPDNWHYFGTIYTAAAFLSNYSTNDADQINKHALLPFNDLRHDFCLTNYYKCAFKKEEDEEKYHDVGTNIQMRKNCVRILLDEIKALRPDIIVIQGKFCHSSFWDKKGLLSFASAEWNQKLIPEYNISITKYKRTNGSYFYVLWSYHPCAHGRRWFNTLPALNAAITYIKNDMQY